MPGVVLAEFPAISSSRTRGDANLSIDICFESNAGWNCLALHAGFPTSGCFHFHTWISSRPRSDFPLRKLEKSSPNTKSKTGRVMFSNGDENANPSFRRLISRKQEASSCFGNCGNATTEFLCSSSKV